MISEERWKKAQAAEADNWADTGRNSWRLLYELTEHSDVAKQLHSLLNGRTNLVGLEVGVGLLGIGFLAVHTFPYFSRIVGVEPLSIVEIDLEDKALTKYTKELQSRVEVVKVKGENLPFADHSFDTVCCINVIDHSHSPDQILKEIARVTKPDGIFVFGVNTLSLLGRQKWRMLRFLNPNKPLFVAHPHILSWRCARGMASPSWSILWENKPSGWQRFAGHGRMSFWILERVR